MPYEWIIPARAPGQPLHAPATTSGLRQDTDVTPPVTDAIVAQLHLWPYRSLPRRGFVLFIALTCMMLSLPLLAVLGTVVWWVLFPFLGLAVALVWLALSLSYRSGEILEELTLRADRLTLTRSHRGQVLTWEANPYWARLELHPSDGPVADYLTLTGGPREVELGRFLTPEERRDIARDIRGLLARI